jgi:hypothetical protein
VQAALGDQVDGSVVHRLWQASRDAPLYLRELVFGESTTEVSRRVGACVQGESKSRIAPDRRRNG